MLICAQGALGSGKTLLISYLAWLDQQESGRRVWANYPLRFAEPLRSWSELFGISEGVVCLDEAHVEIDSRSFGRNIEFTGWLLQTRKMGLDVLYSTQNINQVDMRLRNITDILCLCERIGLPGSVLGSRVQLFDLASMRRLSSFVLRHTPELYGLYDTKARVFPLRRDRDSYGLSS